MNSSDGLEHFIFNDPNGTASYLCKESDKMWRLFCKFNASINPSRWPSNLHESMQTSIPITSKDVEEANRVYNIYAENYEAIDKTTLLIHEFLGITPAF